MENKLADAQISQSLLVLLVIGKGIFFYQFRREDLIGLAWGAHADTNLFYTDLPVDELGKIGINHGDIYVALLI